MEFSKEKIDQLRSLIEREPCNIVIVSHTNPDGDAIGSSLAWASVLRRYGHNVEFVVPNRYPVFLEWLDGISSIVIFKNNQQLVEKLIAQADIIFCLDFNQIHRLEGIGELMEKNKKAKLVLIDHHLDPPPIFDLEISNAESSSTSFMIYKLIENLDGTQIIDKTMAEQIYVGIMTDTGSFSFGFLTPELFRAVAVLLEKGIDIPYINRKVYHSFSVDRLRLLGHTLQKIETMTVNGNQVAYIALKESELREFNFQMGDSEGFVNYPLSIRDLALSTIFIETRNFIRISFRSRPDVDVSKFAKLYFNGGGHKNAAGGKSYVSMAETIENYKKAVQEFFGDASKHNKN